MKRHFIPLIAALIAISVSTSTHAQIAVGPKAGVNFNSFRKSETFRNYFDPVGGFNVGGFAKYPVMDFLNARVELLYFQQGGNLYDYRVINELYRSDAKVKFHNFEVPVLAEFGLPSLKEDPLQPKLLLGACYSYTVYARETFTNIVKISGRDKISYDGFLNSDGQFNKGQIGLIGGLAAEMKMFNVPVTLEFRYQYNLTRANKAGTQNSYNLQNTTEKWGNELKLHTLSINVAATLFYF
ncbi:MAG TPA: porin family protein [Chryseosolibacter sp.]